MSLFNSWLMLQLRYGPPRWRVAAAQQLLHSAEGDPLAEVLRAYCQAVGAGVANVAGELRRLLADWRMPATYLAKEERRVAITSMVLQSDSRVADLLLQLNTSWPLEVLLIARSSLGDKDYRDREAFSKKLDGWRAGDLFRGQVEQRNHLLDLVRGPLLTQQEKVFPRLEGLWVLRAMLLAYEETSDAATAERLLKEMARRWPQHPTLLFDELLVALLEPERGVVRTALRVMANRYSSSMYYYKENFRESLGKHGNSLQVLLTLLQDENSVIRRAVAELLGDLGQVQYEPPAPTLKPPPPPPPPPQPKPIPLKYGQYISPTFTSKWSAFDETISVNLNQMRVSEHFDYRIRERDLANYDRDFVIKPSREEKPRPWPSSYDRREMRSAIEPLLNDACPTVANAALVALARLGDPSVIGLTHAEATVQVAVAQALGEAAIRTAIDPLVERLRANDSAVCVAAVVALGRMRHYQTVGPLLNAMAEMPCARTAAADALLELCKAGVEKAEIVASAGTWIKHEDPDLRYQAARILATQNDVRAMESLLDHFHRENYDALQRLADILSLQGSPLALRAWIEFRRQNEPQQVEVAKLTQFLEKFAAVVPEPILRDLVGLEDMTSTWSWGSYQIPECMGGGRGGTWEPAGSETKTIRDFSLVRQLARQELIRRGLTA